MRYFALVLLVGCAVVVGQVFVMKTHFQETQDLFEATLLLHQAEGCALAQGEIKHWAAVLLLITRTDFSPGVYRRVPFVNTDPRSKSKQLAISVLPRSLFKIGDKGVNVDTLTVKSEIRKPLWRWYVLLCYVSWVLFFIGMVISQKLVSTPHSS